MQRDIRQTILLLLFSTVIAILFNSISGNGIPLVGNWPTISGSDSVLVPPSAEEGDPPFISLDDAAARYQSPETAFIDARDPEDYAIARIKGSINVPFDYLEENWDAYNATGFKKSKEIIIYCSGAECESSLMLGREMAFQGYTNIHIFYGGWREWERAGLPIEKGSGDD
jgi:rhodanese-related sulfurtransferase